VNLGIAYPRAPTNARFVHFAAAAHAAPRCLVWNAHCTRTHSRLCHLHAHMYIFLRITGCSPALLRAALRFASLRAARSRCYQTRARSCAAHQIFSALHRLRALLGLRCWLPHLLRTPHRAINAFGGLRLHSHATVRLPHLARCAPLRTRMFSHNTWR